MFNIIRKELDWGGRPLTLETGRLARQADGAVLATLGETSVLATVCASREPRPGADFFPLTVHYQEKYFAAGKIPGGFFKREARPTEKEVLTSRLIDRPIRPLFPKGYRCEVQVIASVLSHDLENDPDIVAMVGVSAALAASGVPFEGPIGAARVGFVDGSYVLNPLMHEYGDSQLDLVVAGTGDAVMMVESEADELSEKEMLDAVTFGHREMQPVIAAIRDLAAETGVERREYEAPDVSAVADQVAKLAAKDVDSAVSIADKRERRERMAEIRQSVLEKYEDEEEAKTAAACLGDVEKQAVRGRILDRGQRIDGRDLETVRPISCEVGELPRTHGSAVFTRGETQAMVVTTLGTSEDEQIMDSLHANYRERFLLHYNFPPFSVGETRRVGPPGRREIGHGKLAWRALRPVLPSAEDFPYTMRVVSEILESNGSSSMATVCGSSLSMMDAGVPLKRPVAGIAMGLILEGDKYAVLTDILGDEDHLGDMDFKVAGTDQGVTSLQMDIKVAGITEEIMQVALEQANRARMHILDEMAKALSEGRQEFSRYAPRIEIVNIPVARIRDLIGTGGKVIRGIVEETGAKINVDDEGVVKIASSNQEQIEAARARVLELTSDPEVDRIYNGKVVKLMDFGAFVNFFGAKDGLVHVSQMAEHRVRSPSDILSEGQFVRVRFTGTDDRGKYNLTMRGVDQSVVGEEEPEEAPEAPPEAPPAPEPRPAERRRESPPAQRDEPPLSPPPAEEDEEAEIPTYREAYGESPDFRTRQEPDGSLVEGEVYEGVVRDVRPFGALVEFQGSRVGLVHKSELSDRPFSRTWDVVERGQAVNVLYQGTDGRDRVQLSMRGVPQPEPEERGGALEDGADWAPARNGARMEEDGPASGPRAAAGYGDEEQPAPRPSISAGYEDDDRPAPRSRAAAGYEEDGGHPAPRSRAAAGYGDEERPAPRSPSRADHGYEADDYEEDYGAYGGVPHGGVDAEPVEGECYEGEVTTVKEYGAFVRFLGRHEALVHVSNMPERRVNVHVGDMVRVWHTGIDRQGRVQLSMNGPKAPPPQTRPQEGEVYDGDVVNVQLYGAFVRFLDGHEALVHVSNMEGREVNVALGQKVKVRHIGVDHIGRIQLSMRGVDQKTGEVRGGEESDGVMKTLSAGRGERTPRRRWKEEWDSVDYGD